MSTDQIENEISQAVQNLTAKKEKSKRYEKVVTPKKIKGTPDVNLKPNTLGARFLRGVWSYILITIGTLFVAAGVYFFKFPNHFTVGGVSSLSVVLANYFTFSESQFMAIANLILLVVALIIFGKNFAIKTIYSSAVLTASTLCQ